MSYSTLELTTLSEVELQQKEATPGEEESPRPRRSVNMDRRSQEDVIRSPLPIISLSAAAEESEDEILEHEGNRDQGQEETNSDEVPKHRRTYCRKANCETCKAQCGNCPDCLNSNAKTSCRERPQCPDKKPRDPRQGKGKCVPQALTPGKGSGNAGESKNRGRNMLRRSQGISGGTPVKIPEIFRAPVAPEDAEKSKKRKQGGASDEENKRRNTSSELEDEEGGRRRNPFAGTMNNSSTTTQMKRISGLPVFSAKCKAGEAAPQEVVLGPNP